MVINWPYVRQIILNDRVHGYKPDKACLKKFSFFLPDVKILGFGRYYDYTWYLLIESRYFPATIDPVATRGSIPATSLFGYLTKKEIVGVNI